MGRYLDSQFYSIGLFFCQYQAALRTVALYYTFKSGIEIPPTLFFFLRIAVAIQGLFLFQMNFCIVLSMSVKYAAGILMGGVLNL